ncbi:MAG TPA: GAP family protein [Anaerolineae bacterium]|nr:GAP family protein [Anaerolineae bacterium]
MLELLLILVPLGLGAAVVQLPQIAVPMFLLQIRPGPANGVAYVGSTTVVHLILGAVLWMVATRVETSVEREGGGPFSLVLGTTLAVLGLMLLVYAARLFFSVPDEGDAATTSWLDKMQSVSPGRAALLGVALLVLDPKDWVFTLSAVELIVAADLSGVASLLTYLVFVLVVQSLLLALLALTLLSPQRAQEWLGGLNVWLKRHMRTLKIGGSGLLGVYLLFTGLKHFGLF